MLTTLQNATEPYPSFPRRREPTAQPLSTTAEEEG